MAQLDYHLMKEVDNGYHPIKDQPGVPTEVDTFGADEDYDLQVAGPHSKWHGKGMLSFMSLPQGRRVV